MKNKNIYGVVLAVVLVSIFSITSFATSYGTMTLMQTVSKFETLGTDALATATLLIGGWVSIMYLKNQRTTSMILSLLLTAFLIIFFKAPTLLDWFVNDILNTVK